MRCGDANHCHRYDSITGSEELQPRSGVEGFSQRKPHAGTHSGHNGGFPPGVSVLAIGVVQPE